MTPEHIIILVLIVAMGVGLLAALGFSIYTTFRLARILMHFHNAGNSMAQLELRKAEIDVEKLRAEAQVKAEENRETENRMRDHRPRPMPASAISE